MIRTIISVSGMACGMCEAHINDAVRAAVPVRKVSSSHAKGETVILSETAPDYETLKRAITSLGYTVQAMRGETVTKKPLFGFLKR